jgi:hypothetical protein
MAERVSQLRTINYMTRLLRNLFFFACAAIVLAGCQHPLAPSVAGQHPVGATYAFVDAGTTVRCDNAFQPPAPAVTERADALKVGALESPKPQDERLVASVQKQPVSQTGELADGLMLVFKTFTGH